MKTNRPYRKAMEQHQVFTILESEAGKKLDPLILASFIRMIERKATPA
jgi:HD-GYP domain-containing protein (c-di-GMP phosphodiesterase class II)